MKQITLKEEFEYYIAHQSDFVSKFAGNFVVLKNNEVLGVYGSEIEAYQETQKNEEIGTFLIQFVNPGEENYTQTFCSQATF